MPVGIRHALERAVHDARAQFDRAIARADQLLENAEDEHFRTISQSAEKIAALTNQLETFEALENERMARQARTELAAAEISHREVVDGANKRIEQAFATYIRTFSSAATGMECSFNATAAGLKNTKPGS